MAIIFNCVDDWRNTDLVCAECGWKGRIDPAQVSQYRDLVDVPCPACDRMLAIVNLPTEQEIREHWDELSEEERAHYGRRFDLEAEFEAHHLEEPSQLPDIDDDPLVLVWDVGWERTSQAVIVHNGRAIWHEPGYYECIDRFGEVVDVLKAKYGERLEDLVPTERSLFDLLGDHLSAWDKLDDFRKRMAPESVDPEVRLEALARAHGATIVRVGPDVPASTGDPVSH